MLSIEYGHFQIISLNRSDYLFGSRDVSLILLSGDTNFFSPTSTYAF